MDIKKDQIDQTLPLAIQILRARAAEHRKTWMDGLPEDTHVGPWDAYTAWSVYDTCAAILAEALDGNYSELVKRIGDSTLSKIPDKPCNTCMHRISCPTIGDPSRCSPWSAWNLQVTISDNECIDKSVHAATEQIQ